jgi:uncharacterized protein YecT (DUF1311 family)
MEKPTAMTSPSIFPWRRVMPAMSGFILLVALFGSPSHAASFNCEQANTRVEKLICGDDLVSELDSKLNDAYQASYDISSPDGKRQLLAEQRRWLASDRNKCVDVGCLSRSYEARIHELDPFEDGMLTCAEMRKHPGLIFSPQGIDLGSGAGSPTDFDYDCPESLASQGFM